jgi:hypothetical protein
LVGGLPEGLDRVLRAGGRRPPMGYDRNHPFEPSKKSPQLLAIASTRPYATCTDRFAVRLQSERAL